MTDESKIADVIDQIGKALFPRGTIKDSVAWDDGERAGWIMDAKRLGRLIDADGFTRFTGEQVHFTLRSLGIRDRMFEYERGPMAPSDFLDRLKEVVGAEAGLESYLTLTFIPEPGYPWPAPYYSRKRGRVIQGDRPWWMADNPARNADGEMVPALDFCKFMPPLSGYEEDAEVLCLGRERIVVTHAMGAMDDLTRKGTWEANAKSVNDCGGLLFPSLAIGVPATNFGPFLLVADVGLITRSLKPGRHRGEDAPAQVYDTDVWTMTTSTFEQEAGISAFEQLTGHGKWMYYLDMNAWPLGLPRAPELHGPGAGNRLERLAQLKREVAERRRIWSRSMSPEEHMELRDERRGRKAWYPYLEAKANGVMPISSFPMAVQPVQASDGFMRFLDATGFQGELLTVELPDEMADAMRDTWPTLEMGWKKRSMLKAWAEHQYAWNVQDAILDYGREVSA